MPGTRVATLNRLMAMVENELDLHVFDSGAVRDTSADDERWDLIPPRALRRLAMTCHEGAVKYGEHNWRKGIPLSNLLNHAIRHIFLYLANDTSEDHLAHAVWNLCAAMEFEETRPELVDIWKP